LQIFVAITSLRNGWFVSFRYVLLGALCVIALSCNDAPGPVGSGLIPSDNITLVTVSSDTIPLLSSTEVGQFTPRLGSDIAQVLSTNPAFIGAAIANDNPGTFITGTTFLSFNPPVFNDSLREAYFSTLTPDDILAASLLVSPGQFILGDSLRQIASFRIHAVTRPWYSDNSQQAINLQDPSLIGRQVGAHQAISTNSLRIDASQTLTRKVRLPITDKLLILRWLRTGSVAWSSVDGLALVPDTATARTMYALTDGSRIVIRLRSATSETGDTVITMNEFARSSIVRSALPNNSGGDSIIIQGGAALRTRIDFDLSRLPPFATIHRAELVLNVDTVRSTISNFGLPFSIQLYPAQNAAFPAAQRAFESQRNTISAVSAVGIFDNTTGTARYVFSSTLNMSSVVESILKNGGKKSMILQLRPELISGTSTQRSDEEQTTTRIVFHGLRQPDLSLRPRLIITYSNRYSVPR
jgi:hypothetical protein